MGAHAVPAEAFFREVAGGATPGNIFGYIYFTFRSGFITDQSPSCQNIEPSKKVLNATVGPFPLYGEKSRLIVLVGYFCYTDAINFSLLSIAAKVALLHCNGL